MGDDRRNDEFATFITRNFPKVKIVLDVAGGKGLLARALANKGKKVIIVDAKPRFSGNIHRDISYHKCMFMRDNATFSPDMVVGMHPDEATAEIVHYAGINHIPFAVVPCCIMGEESYGIHDYKGWCNKLKSVAVKYGMRVMENRLHINGKNMVIAGVPNKTNRRMHHG